MSDSGRRNKVNKKKLRTVIIIIVAVAVVITATVLVLQNRVAAQYGEENDEVITSEVTKGSISTTVTGTGTLENEEAEEVDIPGTVEIDTIYVEEGDAVAAGDLLATVNNASIISAMSDIQDEIEELDGQLEDASGDTVSSRVTSSVSGRVKEIYVSPGDDISSVMYENNALLLISLDGYMAVDIDAGSLSKGDEVTVTALDGEKYSGEVSEVRDDTAVILLTDNGPLNGDTVTVSDASGAELGSGGLYIHNPIKITGYAGTVSSVNVKENARVSSGTRLITLKDTSYTANYDSILSQREDLEEELERLVVIYKEGAVYAPITGTIESIAEPDDEEDSADAQSAEAYSAAALAAAQTASGEEDTGTQIYICPIETMSVSAAIDESNILSLSLGQEAAVTVDSIGEDEYTGTVTEIETSGASTNGVTQYTAVITIDRTTDMLSGMTASITIKIDGVENALLIPEDALNKTSATAYVYTSYDAATGELTGMTEVTCGLSNGSYVEILSGLSEGDAVCYIKEEESGFRMPGGMSGMSGMGGMSGFSGGSMGGGMPGMKADR